MSHEAEPAAVHPRTSRFKEHTNTNSSIRPPPDELWKDLGIELLIEQFNEENRAPPLSRKTSGQSAEEHRHAASRVAEGPVMMLRASSEMRAPGLYDSQPETSGSGVFGALSVAAHAAPPATPAPAASEGTFGRFQRAFASVFGGVLGKRKAGNVDAEKEKRKTGHVDTEKEKEKKVLDERKRAADAAYQEAKELGLLPTPKVFVRPGMAARSHNCGMQTSLTSLSRSSVSQLTFLVADAATPVRTPRTPRLHHASSKKDLQKQKKLSKRVSELELKLASARKELQSVLHGDALPPVPPLPTVLPPTPGASQSENDADPFNHTMDVTPPAVPAVPAVPATLPAPPAASEPEQPGRKVTKKRKAMTSDEEEYRPIPSDSDGDIDMLASPCAHEEATPKRTVKRVKSSASRRNLKKQPTSRLQQKTSRSTVSVKVDSSPVTIVPDGVGVPPIPEIPKSVRGKKVRVGLGHDGYGGLGHEMF